MNKIKNRYKSMKTRAAKDWWTATFGDPISWLILSLIAYFRRSCFPGVCIVFFFNLII